jgi:glycosyltransferase involved in cell wall biosynthesis
MRILYDHQVTSLQNAGGISLYFYELIRHLIQNNNIQADLLLGSNGTVLPFKSLARNNCRVVSSKSAMRVGYVRYGINDVITNLIASLSGRFDVYHPTLYRCMPMVRSKSIVVTHHDCTQERFPNFFNSMDMRRRVKTKQFEQADAIICVSEYSRNCLLEFYPVRPEKTHVIHLGITPMQPGILPEIALGKSPYVLYVGGRQHYKNFPALLRAFRVSRLAKDFFMICAGGGSFSVGELQLIQREGLQKRIIVFPRVSSEELGALYSHAHTFVYPSLHEGFGLPPVEAMTCGTVPVVSNAASIPEICQDAAIYFDPNSLDSMVDSMEKASYDSKLRETIQERGKVIVTKYSWAECSRKTFQLYRGVR